MTEPNESSKPNERTPVGRIFDENHDCDNCPRKSNCALETAARYFNTHGEDLDDINSLLNNELKYFSTAIAVQLTLAELPLSLSVDIALALGYAIAKGATAIPIPQPSIMDIAKAMAMNERSKLARDIDHHNKMEELNRKISQDENSN